MSFRRLRYGTFLDRHRGDRSCPVNKIQVSADRKHRMATEFSIRNFLRSRKALLVHFSTTKARCVKTGFPEDLHRAIALRGVPLSFATITVGDVTPFGWWPGTGAEGAIGLLVDLHPSSVVESVSPSLDGRSFGENNTATGLIETVPTAQSCADSIDRRVTSNEWLVRDYVPIGIYFIPPIVVHRAVRIDGEWQYEDELLNRKQAMSYFPDQRFFSHNDRDFFEFDRDGLSARTRVYDEIILP
jgi:hypothetical protein